MKKMVSLLLTLSFLGLSACGSAPSGEDSQAVASMQTEEDNPYAEAGQSEVDRQEVDSQEVDVQEVNGQEEGTEFLSVATESTPALHPYSGTFINLSEYGTDLEIHGLSSSDGRVYVLLETREWGEPPEDNNQKQDCTRRYYVLSCAVDGSDKMLSDELSIPSDGYLVKICLADNGCVAALFQPDEGDATKLLFWDAFGYAHWEKDADAFGSLYLCGEEIWLLSGGDDESGCLLQTYDFTGALTNQFEIDQNVFGSGFPVFSLDGGKFVYQEKQAGETYIHLYDMGLRTDEVFQFEESWEYDVVGTVGSDILLCDGIGLYRYAIGEAMPRQICSYLDLGLNLDRFLFARQADETHLACIFRDGNSVSLGIFHPDVARESIQTKAIVVGATGGLDLELQGQMLSFNEGQDDYKLTVRNLYAGVDGDDSSNALDASVLAKNMPDILLVDEKMPIRSYVAEGLIADVGEWIERDEELDVSQFLGNALDALRIDGKLYYVAPTFCVDTYVAKQSKVGGEDGWNWEEFLSVESELGDKEQIVPDTSRYQFLEDYMDICGESYVDWDLGTCDFQKPDFILALQYAATLPEEDFERPSYDRDGFDSRYLADQALLMPVTIANVGDLDVYPNGCIGEEISYMGYPTEGKDGSCIRPYGKWFALSSQSAVQDGAWKFLRQFLAEEYQMNGIHGQGLPIRADAFEKSAQEALVKEDGYCFIDGEYVSVMPLTQEQVDRATDFISGVQRPAFRDSTINGFVRDGADLFFQGQVDAEEAARQIQAKVQEYVFSLSRSE